MDPFSHLFLLKLHKSLEIKEKESSLWQFQYQYDSRVVIYNCREFIRLAADVIRKESKNRIGSKLFGTKSQATRKKILTELDENNFCPIFLFKRLSAFELLMMVVRHCYHYTYLRTEIVQKGNSLSIGSCQYLTDGRIGLSEMFKNGPNPGSFCLFLFFSHDNYIAQIL